MDMVYSYADTHISIQLLTGPEVHKVLCTKRYNTRTRTPVTHAKSSMNETRHQEVRTQNAITGNL